jgi:hypothetical protein
MMIGMEPEYISHEQVRIVEAVCANHSEIERVSNDN